MGSNCRVMFMSQWPIILNLTIFDSAHRNLWPLLFNRAHFYNEYARSWSKNISKEYLALFLTVIL